MPGVGPEDKDSWKFWAPKSEGPSRLRSPSQSSRRRDSWEERESGDHQRNRKTIAVLRGLFDKFKMGLNAPSSKVPREPGRRDDDSSTVALPSTAPARRF